MGLIKYKLGDLIEQRREKNNNYNVPIRGVSRNGFIEPKQKDADTSLYNVFYKYDFVFNPARMELNSIALNTELEKGICSSLYEIFYIKEKSVILPEYLNLFLKRNEFARLCEFLGSGSAREYCRFQNISEIDILVPDIKIQKKYVAIYKAMKNNLKVYKSNLEDLKLVCNSYIEKLKKTYKSESIGSYITQINEKNNDGKIKLEQGINIEKEFITPQRSNSNLKSRVIVRRGDFAYCTQLNNENVAIACRKGEDCVVSPVYDVFRIKNSNKILNEYLLLWLIRPEFGRYMYWLSEGTSYEFLKYENLCKVKIPIPPIEIQKSIIEIYNNYSNRKQIAVELKHKIDNICSVLIAGAVKEARENE